MSHRINPLACPAQQGNGIDIMASDFTLEVHDCANDNGGRETITEIFGFFRPDGEEYENEGQENDALLTAIVHVPARSPIACIAHEVHADRSGSRTQKVEERLRINVALCPCMAKSECPALNESSLLLALERAVD